MYQIVAPHFTAGIVVNEYERICTKAAPIVDYMVGWPMERIFSYCMRKGWKIGKVTSLPESVPKNT